jgi:hypothetical protein
MYYGATIGIQHESRRKFFLAALQSAKKQDGSLWFPNINRHWLFDDGGLQKIFNYLRSSTTGKDDIAKFNPDLGVSACL